MLTDGESRYTYDGQRDRQRAGLDNGNREKSIVWYQAQYPLAKSCARYPQEWSPEMTALGYS